MDGPDPLKHRLKLWLKSEQALGLPSVRRVDFGAPPAPPAAPQMAARRTPPPSREPAPPPAPLRGNAAEPAAPRQAEWFGAPQAAAARPARPGAAALPV